MEQHDARFLCVWLCHIVFQRPAVFSRLFFAPGRRTACRQGLAAQATKVILGHVHVNGSMPCEGKVLPVFVICLHSEFCIRGLHICFLGPLQFHLNSSNWCLRFYRHSASQRAFQMCKVLNLVLPCWKGEGLVSGIHAFQLRGFQIAGFSWLLHAVFGEVSRSG